MMPPKKGKGKAERIDEELWGGEETASVSKLTHFGQRAPLVGDSVSYKNFIKKPLPPFELVLSGDPKSGRPGRKPVEVSKDFLNRRINAILAKFPDVMMTLSDPGGASCVLESEASTNAKMQRLVYDVVNNILAQYPNPFFQEFRIRLNALSTDEEFVGRESLGGKMTNACNNLLQPDNECLRCYNSTGEVDLRQRSAIAFEGKRWGLYAKMIEDEEIIKSGNYDLAEAYANDLLSDSGKSSVHQIVGYLVDRKVERGILYTLVALWVITIKKRRPLEVGISQPYTWDCTGPSVREVVLAVTFEALEKMQLETDLQRLSLSEKGEGDSGDGGEEGGKSGDQGGPSKGAHNPGPPSNPAPPPNPSNPAPPQAQLFSSLEQHPSDDELRLEQHPAHNPGPSNPAPLPNPSNSALPQAQHLSGSTLDNEPLPEQHPATAKEQQACGRPAAGPGDQMLKQLEDRSAAHLGNTLVRFGTLAGQPVAAKVAYSRDPEWVHELENESKVLDSLKDLQGRIVPKKVYAGPVHGGKDRLLVTKLVDGRRLDRVQVTADVANSARKALGEIHNLGYIHGDVESRNIVVERSGSCVFVDLGRAKRAKSEKEFARERASLDATLRHNW